MAERNGRAQFLLVGIPERQEQSDAIDAAAMARQYGLEDRCVLLEDRLDMPELYMGMDLCVLPSYREGLPRCLLEAGAMGIAAVATDIRGCREVIVDGETGLLFPLKDVEGFVAVIDRVLADDGLRMKLAQAGQLRVRERYLESLVTERIVGLYESGLGA